MIVSLAALISPSAFLILLISKVQLRLVMFLLIATLPAAVLFFALSDKAAVIYSYGVIGFYADSVIISLVFTLLGIGLLLKAQPKTKAFFAYLLGMIIAGVPLLLMLIFFLIVIITPTPQND